jgi:DNA-binding Lrp family transcriptional regulator
MDRSGSHPGAFAIVQAAAIDDTRMGSSALRMLLALGIYRDTAGWCWPKQRQLAERLGISQQAVSKALRDLASMGYIEMHDQYNDVTGARMSSRYRIVMEYVLPIEYQRTPQPDVVTPQLHVVAPTTSEVVAPTTSEVVAINNPELTTQSNEEKEVPELSGTVVVVGADRATAAAEEKPKALKVSFGSLSDDARSVVDDWRAKQGKTRPPKLNPTQAAYLEDAVSDLGADRLCEANTWAAQNGVPEFVKAIRAARTKRQRDEGDGYVPELPHANGSASKVTPATDDDRAIWDRALAILGGVMNARNVEAYLAPLDVAGRGEDGGLWLVVNSATAEHTAKFKHHISRALEDAGDRNPTAVCFKARKTRGQTNGEA